MCFTLHCLLIVHTHTHTRTHTRTHVCACACMRDMLWHSSTPVTQVSTTPSSVLARKWSQYCNAKIHKALNLMTKKWTHAKPALKRTNWHTHTLTQTYIHLHTQRHTHIYTHTETACVGINEYTSTTLNDGRHLGFNVLSCCCGDVQLLCNINVYRIRIAGNFVFDLNSIMVIDVFES